MRILIDKFSPDELATMIEALVRNKFDPDENEAANFIRLHL
jgi:hypothetical protein